MVVAYSVHVGEKIAHCENVRVDKKILTVAKRRRVGQSKNLNLAGETAAVAGKLGVKTRWLENTRAHITREIIRGFENFPLRKQNFCR